MVLLVSTYWKIEHRVYLIILFLQSTNCKRFLSEGDISLPDVEGLDGSNPFLR